jgi:hypothetical protein
MKNRTLVERRVGLGTIAPERQLALQNLQWLLFLEQILCFNGLSSKLAPSK